MTITLIAAQGTNKEIGKNNQLLWHLPKDLQRFKKLTLNKPIIMGRKTFDSLPGVLPQRKHIVISRSTTHTNPSVLYVNSIEKAIEEAKKISPTIFIIGGGTIYEKTITLADILEITQVHYRCDADTFFPTISKDKFELQYREFHPKNKKNKYDFEFLRYKKK